jgi:hypothetical protein
VADPLKPAESGKSPPVSIFAAQGLSIKATTFSGMKNSRDRSPAHRTELLQTTAPSFAEHLGSGDEALGTVTLTPKPAALPLE